MRVGWCGGDAERSVTNVFLGSSNNGDNGAAGRARRAAAYMQRAAELRALAATMTTPEARARLLTTAAEYEKMAAALMRQRG